MPRAKKPKSVPQLVAEVLKASSQPLSLAEICHRVTAKRGKTAQSSQVRVALSKMLKNSEISSRVETAEERAVRSGGKEARGAAATLYSYGKAVPRRTETFADFILGDGQTTRFYIKTRAPLALATKTKTKTSIDLAECAKSLLDERAELKRRLLEVETEIRAARKALSE